VTEATKEDYIVMELSVRPEDLGKVIGKNGQTARAIPHARERGREPRRREDHLRDSRMIRT
jgi:transcription antitermination factor NusA-like protein